MLRIHTGFWGVLASCRMALLAAIFLPTAAHADDRYLLNITNPQPFPDITFKVPGGGMTSLSKEKGKLTVVHFWATWCVPCIDELPEINEIQKKYEVIGLKVIGISMDGENNFPKVKAFLEEHKLLMKPYLDVGTSAFTDAKIKGLPTSVFINEKGERIAISEGKLDWLNPRTTGFLEFNLYNKK